MDTSDYRLGYRGDIEGLRAIAILLVIAAHASVPWLSGGFVGVDVFFVLSGYLITGLLLREINQTGKLRFAGFYARRFRRLLPALLVMLICTSLVATVTLAPAAQHSQAIAGATAAVWLSNIHFALSQLDYFSASATNNLFLHTWSLGVEEQFYLVWPALMVCVLLKQADKATLIKRLKMVMHVLAASSAIACIALTQTSPQLAFYMMPLRAWQFAVGALVWLHFSQSVDAGKTKERQLQTGSTYRAGGWVGLAMIVAAGVWFDANSAYPGWRALLPTAGAAMVIVACVGTVQSGVSRLLSWQPLQAIGRISYSWYLWHWPVLLLGIAAFGNDALHRAALVAVSLLLAMVSYRWVESPIRHQARLISRPGVAIIAAVMLMFAANVLCIRWSNAATAWANSPTQLRYVQAHNDAPAIYMMGCDDWFRSAEVRPCVFGTAHAKHTVVLIGDSIGVQWFPAVATIFNKPDWQLVVLTKSSCPMVDEPLYDARIGREYVECSSWRKAALKWIASLQPDIVFLGSTPTRSFDHKQWVEGSTRVLNVINSSAKHIYILRGTPILPFDGPNCLSTHHWLPWSDLNKDTCSVSAASAQNDNVNSWLMQAAKGFRNVSVLDMNGDVCPANECDAERDGQIVFRDSQHLTATFVESLSGKLASRIDLAPAAKKPIKPD